MQIEEQGQYGQNQMKKGQEVDSMQQRKSQEQPVSYTHLTLPTNREV